jgi:hypothetical protein
MLREISQAQKKTHMIPFMWVPRGAELQRQRKEWCLPGAREDRKLVISEYRLSFLKMKKLWSWVLVMVIP